MAARGNILVTGVPGSGKTTFSKLLCKQLGFRHVDVARAISTNRLYTEWDDEHECSIFDEKATRRFVKGELGSGRCVVDFHTADIFSPSWFDLIVVLTVATETLYDRLALRGYTASKIQENISCLIFRVIQEEVESHYKKKKVLECENDTEEALGRGVERVVAAMAEGVSRL